MTVPADKHTILFLAANPSGTGWLALDREARAIQAELNGSGHRDRFKFETRWAVEPLDLLGELRRLKPVIVHFSGHGGQNGLFFQAADGRAQLVSIETLAETFSAAGASVKLVVLNACYGEDQAKALLAHVDCVVGTDGSLHEGAARSFAIGFYGGLAEGEPIAASYKQGCAAISLEGLSHGDRPQLKVRDGADAMRLTLADAETSAAGADVGAPVYIAVEQNSEQLLVATSLAVPEAARPAGNNSSTRLAVGIVALAAIAAGAALMVAMRAREGNPEARSKLDEIERRLAGFGDPPPPATCTPAIAAEAGELILAARNELAADPAAATLSAERAIDRCPSWAAGHNAHGNALAKTGRLQDAAEAYARALSYAPDYDAPRFNLGLVQLRRNDPAAIATFTEILHRKPDFPDAYYARGRAHLVAKQLDEALADLEEAVHRKPDDGVAWMIIGQLREQLGRKDPVQAYCRAADLHIEGAAVRCKR